MCEHTPVYERERHNHHNNHNPRSRRIGTQRTYLTMNPFLLNIVGLSPRFFREYTEDSYADLRENHHADLLAPLLLI